MHRSADPPTMNATAVLGDGYGTWLSLPRPSSPRWVLPSQPPAVARSAVTVYQPVTLRGLAGWQLARLTAAAGGFRLLGRPQGPPAPVLEALDGYLQPGETIAVAAGNASQRWVALILDQDGRATALGKIAAEENGRRALAREAEALASIAPDLPPPLFAPRLLARTSGLILLEAIGWRARLRPWRLPVEFAAALGRFFRAGVAERDGELVGPVHGDLAPWNILRTNRGWALLDWEASDLAPPFYDLFHYLVQGHVLLGRPSQRTLFAGLQQRNWVGDAVGAYAQAAELSVEEAPSRFVSYLGWSAERQAITSEGVRGRVARERLMAALASARATRRRARP
jgi:phosphotransferase family enzyme